MEEINDVEHHKHEACGEKNSQVLQVGCRRHGQFGVWEQEDGKKKNLWLVDLIQCAQVRHWMRGAEGIVRKNKPLTYVGSRNRWKGTEKNDSSMLLDRLL